MSRVRKALMIVGAMGVIAAGLHLYGIYRVGQDLEAVAAEVNVAHLAIVPHAGADHRMMQVQLEVANPTPDSVRVSLDRIGVAFDDRTLGFADILSRSEATIMARDKVRFEGQSLIWDSTYEQMKAKDEITYHLSGEITVSDEFLWVRESEHQPFAVDLRGMVD
jgi:hypothetical protein